MTQVLLSGKCMVPSSLSRHNKDLEQRTLKPSARHSSRCVTALGSWTNRVVALRQITVTALFYLEDSRRIHPRSMKACHPKDSKRREWRSTRGRGRERVREGERERAHSRGREREGESTSSPPFICFSSPWACPMQIGLSRSAVCFT